MDYNIEVLLEQYYSTDYTATKKLIEFKEQDPVAFVIALINHLGSPSNPEITRKVCAVFLYKEIVPKDLNALRKFVDYWFQFDHSVHENLRVAATNAIFEGSPDLTQQASILLGVFYAVEISKNQYIDQFNELIQIASDNHSENTRNAALMTIEYFVENIVTLSSSGFNSQITMLYNLVLSIFNLFLNIMRNPDSPATLKIVVNAFVNATSFFYRVFSFQQSKLDFIRVVFDYTQHEDLVLDGYRILQKLYENYFSLFEEYMENIFTITQSDMESENENRIIESCTLWQIIAKVEKSKQKKYNANDRLYSRHAFASFFEPLATIIASFDPLEIDSDLENDPGSAAFNCLLALSQAVGEDCLEPLINFVKENISDPDWRLRYAAAFFLLCSSRMDCFIDTNTILETFQVFVSLLDDPNSAIVNIAMWSLGVMCEQIPDLSQDEERFVLILTKVTNVMESSQALYTRSCWLLGNVFGNFSPEEESTILAANFDTLAEIFLRTATHFGQESIAAAYGAINRLIAQTPMSLVDSYGSLLVTMMNNVDQLISSGANSKDSIALFIWLISTIQATVMNMGHAMVNHSTRLMEMLLNLLPMLNSALTAEILPAIGAIARAIQGDFSQYLDVVIGIIFQRLPSAEFISPAAVLVGDIYSSFGSLGENIDMQIVDMLFDDIHRDMIAQQDRSAVFSALGEVALKTVPQCHAWLDRLLSDLDQAMHSMYLEEDHFLGILNCYQSIVPILADIPGGDKCVHKFYKVFEQIFTFDVVDGNVLYEGVLLLEGIIKKFGRRVNVMLNRPYVRKLLDVSINSDKPFLTEAAGTVLQEIEKL
ncbi:hypothetical protein TVAG_364430 [Trichomonas vaginalis G3]|uniref:Importin subunit beta-1/Transportin-1-like TPR repeats domain-containing protein n=1 Tax=Trichomonas vaginalis (strain ATCC PRA-98 / G3) TaxID=412133 RepID=A2E9F4_TRIV3|nr:ribosomal protein import into nucleus [Trichomonas vaginalis G3]EAY10718.1 hypothetical protein TVAG_364430 [Trichomonas vaginalis G3]KAI5538611.1 ribosomal protein import into nucleus [Trichomonas vaginalis G3]|eukprot:XP_001322941.1 hypothetical protein [Trichomonas vaginalis G3]